MSALPLFKQSWFESYAQFKLNSYFKRIQKHLPKDENNQLSDIHEVLKWEKEFIGAMYELFKEMVEFSQDSTKYPVIPGEELREAGLTDFFLPVETKKSGAAVDEGLVEVLGEHKDEGHNQYQCQQSLGYQSQSEEFIAVPISGQLFLQPVSVPELDGPELITLSNHSPYAALVEFDEEENQCTQDYEDNLLEPRPPPPAHKMSMPKSLAQTYTQRNQSSEEAHSSMQSSTTTTMNSSSGTMVPLNLSEADDMMQESPILVDLDSSSESSTSSVEVGRQVTTVKSCKLNSNGMTSPGKRGVNTEPENRNMSYTVATAENNMSLLLHNMALNYGESGEIGSSADELTDWYATFTAEQGQGQQNSNGSASSASQSKSETVTQGQNEGSANSTKTEMENRSSLDPHSNPFYAPSAPMEK